MIQSVPVTLLFADGASCRLQVPCGGSLLEAAADAGLNLLTDCSNGQCGTCTAQLVSGAIELGDYDNAVLPDADRAAGAVLPCVCRVSGSCAIEFPYDSSEALAEEPAPMEATVAAVEAIAAETVRLVIAAPAAIDFEPGQYVRISPPGTGVSRSYSMANRPGREHLEFYIRLVPGGAFSEWLAGARAGDAVQISAPHGSFFLREEARPRLFVAGGTGVAPFLSMLEAAAAAPAVAECPTTLLVGARTPGHLFATGALSALRDRMPGLTVHVAVEQGEAGGAHRGYATDLIPRLGLDPSTRVYLCGPPPMVEAGRQAAESAGLSRKDVLCERFA